MPRTRRSSSPSWPRLWRCTVPAPSCCSAGPIPSPAIGWGVSTSVSRAMPSASSTRKALASRRSSWVAVATPSATWQDVGPTRRRCCSTRTFPMTSRTMITLNTTHPTLSSTSHRNREKTKIPRRVSTRYGPSCSNSFKVCRALRAYRCRRCRRHLIYKRKRRPRDRTMAGPATMSGPIAARPRTEAIARCTRRSFMMPPTELKNVKFERLLR
mmetsp:Transcript_20527/g.58890  ORF Transcript_20527/g.58890 Transcript_20527/m.58890 type:complete len:213 (+) Transcript_20527:161-799(+)